MQIIQFYTNPATGIAGSYFLRAEELLPHELTHTPNGGCVVSIRATDYPQLPPYAVMATGYGILQLAARSIDNAVKIESCKRPMR